MMVSLSAGTFRRPENMTDKDDPTVLYVKSYLLIRTIVGLIGILLPIVLIIGEAYFLKGGVHVKGSISAYYHTSMRDIFVSSLCVAGFLLATYMAGQAWTWDFWLSLVAGVAVLFVVFFPTERPGIPESAPLCGDTTPAPEGCSPIQQELGETPVAAVHFTAAIVFILSLAAICFLFAYREKVYKNNDQGRRFHTSCGLAILAAIVWVIIGGLLDLDIWELTPLYVGEVVSVWAFGASWLAKGKNVRSMLGLEKPMASAQPGS
jgi:MFS family permease